MIQEVKFSDKCVNFNAKAKKDSVKDDESRILPNTVKTRVNQKYDKTVSALTEYPVKGLKGHINSDFYEFLSMGIIPYIAGSAMFMGIFNLAGGKHAVKSQIGKKMALGVIMYGLGKTLTPDLVTRPVAWTTGVDIELPYRNVYYPLPTKPGAQADIYPEHQQRKVYDSREFFRKDLLAKDPDYGVAYYDKIAKKLGLGDDLNDSVTETSYAIQSIVSSAKTAKTLTSYAWAAAGLGLAMQSCWDDFFKTISNRRKYIAKPGEGFANKISGRFKNFGHNTVDISKSFGTNFVKSCKSLWKGETGSKGFRKYAGKAWILFSTALTAGSTLNVIYKAKQSGKLANKDLIDRNQESTVI